MNCGLMVDLWDILGIDKSYVYHGDGSHHTKVKIRYITFRPFMNEVLEGKITKMSKMGINVTMGFFDDIFIPAANLPDVSTL